MNFAKREDAASLDLICLEKTPEPREAPGHVVKRTGLVRVRDAENAPIVLELEPDVTIDEGCSDVCAEHIYDATRRRDSCRLHGLCRVLDIAGCGERACTNRRPSESAHNASKSESIMARSSVWMA
jgi:hypothetical protein